jgi:hypothetical protein
MPKTQMPEVITLGTPEVKGALIIRVVGVKLFTLTTIGFAAKLRVDTNTVSCEGLTIMELPSYTSRALGQTWALIQCTMAPLESSSVTTMVNMCGGSTLG